MAVSLLPPPPPPSNPVCFPLKSQWQGLCLDYLNYHPHFTDETTGTGKYPKTNNMGRTGVILLLLLLLAKQTWRSEEKAEG